MSVSVQGSSAADPGRRAAFFTEAVDAVRRLPGVEAASAVNHAPLVGDVWNARLRRRRPSARARRRSSRRRLPRRAARLLLDAPGADPPGTRHRGRRHASVSDVAVVSETLVRRNFPDGNAIGQRITFDDPTGAAPHWLTIVGVVRDAVSFTWEGNADPTIYLPYLQSASYLESPEGHHAYLTVVVLRTNGEPSAIAGPARAAIWSIDRGVSISEVVTMDDAVGKALARPRFQSTLLGALRRWRSSSPPAASTAS
jgi:putative ABC transport system permease protein